MIVGFLSVDGNKKITEHFKLKEFACIKKEEATCLASSCIFLTGLLLHTVTKILRNRLRGGRAARPGYWKRRSCT